MNILKKFSHLVFIAVFTCSTPSSATTSLFTDLDKPTKEAMFVFPYNGVVILTIKSVYTKYNEPKPKYISAVINETLRGEFNKNATVKFWTYSDLLKIFNFKDLAELKDKQYLLAFNYVNGTDNSFGIEDEFMPFGKDYKKANMDIFRKNLKKIPFAYRSCLIVEIKKARQYRELNYSNFDLNLLVKDIILRDQVYPTDKAYSDAMKNLDRDFKSFHLQCKTGQTLRVHFSCKTQTDVLGNNPPRGTFVLFWNPDRTGDNKYDALSGDRFKMIPLRKINPRELANIRNSPAATETKLKSLNDQIEAYLKERWTVERIHAYTSHPENRDAIPFIHSKNNLKIRQLRTGGQLYPEHEQEIGKIIWETSIKNNDQFGHYNIVAVSDKEHVFAIAADEAFELRTLSREEFEKQLLEDILLFSYRGYWGIAREEYNRIRNYKTLELDGLEPTGEATIQRDKDGKPVSFEIKMGKSVLTADTDENFDIKNVKINGKEHPGWKELLENRVHYSDKMWQLLDEWKAKREEAQKESQKK